jgi:hypothetical protein
MNEEESNDGREEGKEGKRMTANERKRATSL